MINNISAFPINSNISVHEQEIISYFGKDYIYNKQKIINDQNNIFICFSNRCGSNFLAELLESTNFFPLAGEFFNWDTIINNSKIRNLKTFDEYCLFLQKNLQKNNIFLSKVSWQQLFMVSKLGQVPNLINAPKFLFIKRKDVINQAISLLIADQTKAWTSYQANLHNNIQYDYERIALIVKKISESNIMFETYFNLFAADYLTLVYEDICDDPIDAIHKVCNFLKFDYKNPSLDEMKVKKQRSNINEQFKAKFMSDIKKEFTLSVQL